MMLGAWLVLAAEALLALSWFFYHCTPKRFYYFKATDWTTFVVSMAFLACGLLLGLYALSGGGMA